MSDLTPSIIPDVQLVEALKALEEKEGRVRELSDEVQGLRANLEQSERERKELKRTLHYREERHKEVKRQAHEAQSAMREMENSLGEARTAVSRLEKKVGKMETTNKELMSVNSQWDLDFREQGEAFKRYQLDAQQAQSELQELISKLKADKEDLCQQLHALQRQVDQLSHQLASEQRRLAAMERDRVLAGGQPHQVQELKDENTLLRQQLKAFQEDFEAERKDRERLSDEKQSAGLRYEAEITSLKLQLDRCKSELAHYSTESHRLLQQLRLKNQFEEEQYQQHLKSKGYVARSPPLPPLDPYVELDKQDMAMGRNVNSSHSDSAIYQRPSETYLTPSQTPGGHRLQPVAPRGMLARGVESNSAPSTSIHPHCPPSPPHTSRSVTPPSVANSYNLVFSNHAHQPQNRTIVEALPNQIPPLKTEGRHSCPRCGRRFMSSPECDSHKQRCMS